MRVDLKINTERTSIIDRTPPGGWLARIEHVCGCFSWWDPEYGDRDIPGTWYVSMDSRWKVCPEHAPVLRGVPRPVADDSHGFGKGFPWVEAP